MKIDRVPGEFFFKALFMRDGGWELSNRYYSENPYPGSPGTKWPVEVYEDGSIYVPSEEELEEKQ